MSSLDKTTNKSEGEHETLKKRKEVIKGKVNVEENELNRLSKEAPVGILRLDNMGKQRRNQLAIQGEPPSPQPSVDRLSVTFAESYSFFSGENYKTFRFSPKKLNVMDCSVLPDNNASDEEDYSASANAIIQRRVSTRKSKRRSSRRPSSPFSPDILPGVEISRRTSVYTTSSGDTAITVDSLTQELTQNKIFENIRLHKEVLSNVKMQPWNMRKKLKLVMQAKSYVKKHEGALQERFTQTYSIKNILARWNIYFVKNWQHYRREIMNLSNWMIPWERRIKQIESHFGSVVASYFIFLRWLFWINVVTAGVLIAFIAVPEMIIRSATDDASRKLILPQDKYNATNLLTLWDFDGVIKYTPIFYGWYTNKEIGTGYRLPLAFFMTQLVVYVYSFVATLKKMAENSRMSKLSEKGDECIFSWKLFTGWDFMIGNPETAHNRAMSIVMSFKEALLEEAEKKRNERNWKIIWIRVFVNLAVLGLFALSAAAVVVIVKRSTEPEGNITFWRRNETAVVMSFISFIFPMILEILGFMERYHPRKQLRVQLARIMLLNLLNIYSLVFAQFDRIDGMTDELSKFKPNNTTVSPVDPSVYTELISTIMPTEEITVENCTKICFDTVTQPNNFNVTHLISLITTSVATTALPIFLSSLDPSNSVNYSSTVQTFYENRTISESNFTGLNWNDTDCCNETTTLNNSLDYQSLYNMSWNESYELIISNFADTFQDYLRYVLEHVSDDNSSIYLNDSLVFNVTDTTFNFTTENSNFTDSDYDFFKATLVPILNASISEGSSSSFDRLLPTFYDEIKNTITTTTDKFLDSFPTCEIRCAKTIQFAENKNYTSTDMSTMDTSNWSYQNLTKLRSLCWETMFGQEIVKLTVMDFIFTVVGTVGMDFVRGVFVRIMNNCWCWDLEKKFPEYAEFKVAENILHLVNNQGMVWMGMFFSPGIVLINVIKLMLLMYLRSWSVLTCNVPHSVIFRASRSNNFYFALLLTMLFLCVLPVGYAIVWVQPSWHCGPFSQYNRIFHIFTTTIRLLVPPKLHKPLDYIVSPGIVIPILVLLILVIYYLISLTNSLREANADLRIQLRQERTEERRKMFQVANRQRRTGSGGLADTDNTPFTKWKKLLGNLPSVKSTDDTSKGMPTGEVEQPKPETTKPDHHKTKATFSKFIRRALRKPSLTSEEESSRMQDEATDTEQPDSLPDDVNIFQERTRSLKNKRNSLYTLGCEKNQSEGLLRKGSVDSHESKHVQIVEKPKIVKKSSFDISTEEWANRTQNYSRPSSATSIEKKLDSLTSNWSDKVPVITVSKTQSSECIVKHYQEYVPSSYSGGKDEETNIEQEFKPKVKYVLKKQSEVFVPDVSYGLNVKENNEEQSEGSEDLSIASTVKCVVIDVKFTDNTDQTKENV